MKALARQLLPPLLTEWLRGRRPARGRQDGAIRFAGDYPSWEEARRHTTGYDSPVILARTRDALLQVKNGTAVFERDAVLLPVPEPPMALLAGLLRAAAEKAGRLHVLDYGGSLGSSYFQCRNFLAPLSALRWSVVEQPAHVACGQREFADDRLQFFASVEDCLAAGRPDVLLLSSVVQYLPAPHEFLACMLRHQFDWIMVDRTAFHDGPRDRLTVQQVPEAIYPASYPAWFFSESRWRQNFPPAYECLAAFPALDRPELPDGRAYARGMIYRHR